MRVCIESALLNKNHNIYSITVSSFFAKAINIIVHIYYYSKILIVLAKYGEILLLCLGK